MSELKVTSISHPSASAAGITLGSDGSVVLPSGFTGGLGTNVVQAVKTDTFTTTSSGATLADITGLAVTITPTAVTSKILLICTFGVLDSNGNLYVFGDVTRNSTAIGVGDVAGSRVPVGFAPITATSNRSESASWSFLDSPATTSPVTYQARLGGNAGTKYLNRTQADVDSTAYPRGVSTITAIEVAA